MALTNHEKVANIIAFLSILFGEDSDSWNTIMKFSPQYIIEKFERYVLSKEIEYPWGIHQSAVKKIFQPYIDRWNLELKEEEK